MQKKMKPKTIIALFFFLLVASYKKTFPVPVTILPPDQSNAQLANGIANGLGALIQGLVARQMKEEQDRQIKRAYLNNFAANIRDPKLKDIIGAGSRKNPFIPLMFLILSALTIAAFFLKKRYKKLFKIIQTK